VTPPRRRALHLLLFLATLATTTTFGAVLGGGDLRHPGGFARGLVFSLPLLLILGAHELAHYLTARRAGIDASLPWFIPSPLLPGTFGAIIRIRSIVPDRRSLLFLGLSGPATSFVLSIVAAAIGIPLSREVPLEGLDGGWILGSPLVLTALTQLLHGPVAAGQDLLFHPLAFAGWIGLLVTAINLLPLGQPYGGHVAYAIFGRHHRAVARITLAALIPLGLWLWEGWLLWAVLGIVFGLDHPPCLDDRPLGKEAIWPGIIGAAILVASFTPVPVSLP
jgi:membrane-associated protease RseP (regulator of RpoE activity)